MRGSGNQMTAGGERVGDGGVGSEKALGRAGRTEALHLPLSQSDRDMRAFRSVVLAPALDVLGAETKLPGSSAIGPQSISYQLGRDLTLVLQQFARQA